MYGASSGDTSINLWTASCTVCGSWLPRPLARSSCQAAAILQSTIARLAIEYSNSCTTARSRPKSSGSKATRAERGIAARAPAQFLGRGCRLWVQRTQPPSSRSSQWSHALFAFLFVLIFSLQPSAFSLQAAEPAAVLWSLKGKTNTVFLLGSVHFLRPSEQLPTAIDAAYADAEKLVMEIDMDDLDPLHAQQVTLELGMLPEGQTLESQLGAATYAKVSEHAKSVGIDPILLNRFRPWLAALTLVQLQLMKMGLDANSGIEQRFVARAAHRQKRDHGLETLREQLAMMANLPRSSNVNSCCTASRTPNARPARSTS